MNLCVGGHTTFCRLPTHYRCSAPTRALRLDPSGQQVIAVLWNKCLRVPGGLIPHGHHYLELQVGGWQASVISKLCTFLLASRSSGTRLWVLNTSFRESPCQGGSWDALTPFLSSQPGFLCSPPMNVIQPGSECKPAPTRCSCLSWLGCSMGSSQGEIVLI